MIVYVSELVCRVCDTVIASAVSEIRTEPRGSCPADPRHETQVLIWNEEREESGH